MSHLIRRRLWTYFLDLCKPLIPWEIVGAFNCVLGTHRKRVGRLPNRIACEEFVVFTNATNLIHMHTHGAGNGRQGRRHVEVRLDRVIYSSAWISL